MKIMFAITFSLARMGCGPYLTTVTLTADYPFLIKVGVGGGPLSWPFDLFSQCFAA